MVDYEPMKLDFIRSYDPEPNPDKESLQEAAELINNAQRPLVLVGQGVELGNAQDELRAFIAKSRYALWLYFAGTFGYTNFASFKQRNVRYAWKSGAQCQN